MSKEVLYRRWRPQRFSDVAGQEPVTRTLANAVAQGRLSHAYLFCGPRGTGKTTTGRILAKAMNCTNPQDGEPCDACESCRAFLEGRAMDLVEMDAASNRGIDDIRSLRERVGYAPGSSRYKVYLIDEVHELTAQAFDALLKTLEEPPAHVVFILATTEAHRVPATILSRCQRYDFRRIPLHAMVARLAYIAEQEGISADEEALTLIARQASGALRDAINLLEQMVAFYGTSLDVEQVRQGLGLTGDPRSKEMIEHTLRRDLAGALRVLNGVRDDGVDLRQFQREVVDHLRALLLVKAGAGDGLDLPQHEVEALAAAVRDVGSEDIVAALRAFGEADLRLDPHSTLPLELAAADCILLPAAPVAAPKEALRPAPAPRPAASAAQPRSEVPREAAPGTPPDAAQAPPVEDAAPAAGGTADVPPAADPELVERIRLHLRNEMRQMRASAILNGSCVLVSLTETELTLGFFPKAKFHMGQMEAGENRRLVEQAAAKVLGRAVKVSAVMLEEDQRPRKSGGHLVRAAREMGARVIIDRG